MQAYITETCFIVQDNYGELCHTGSGRQRHYTPPATATVAAAAATAAAPPPPPPPPEKKFLHNLKAKRVPPQNHI
jgi:hypothetical protein